MKIIFSMFVVLCVSLMASLGSAKAEDFKVFHENDSKIVSLHSFSHYEYPRVMTIVKTKYKATGKERVEMLVMLCDEWKIATIDINDIAPHLNDMQKINNWPIKPVDIVKDTVGAEVFNMFCSELHKRTKK